MDQCSSVLLFFIPIEVLEFALAAQQPGLREGIERDGGRGTGPLNPLHPSDGELREPAEFP